MGLIKLLARIFIFIPMLKKFGEKKTVLIGFATYFASYTWLIFVEQLWEYMAIFVLVGFATSCTLAVMSGMMSRSVGKERQGEMMGLNTAADNVSQILGPTLGSYLLSLPSPFLYGISTAAFSLITLLLGFIPLQKE